MPDTTTFLQAAAAQNQWLAITPELLLGGLAVLLLVLEMILPKSKHSLIPSFAVLGQLAILVSLAFNLNNGLVGETTFGGLLHHTETSQFLRLFFVLSSTLVSILGLVALNKKKLPRTEFFHIVLVVSAAMMLLAQANNFVLLFVALETVTVGFYVLVSYIRDSALSLEAGLKYLITGALSSSLLLLGIVLLYGVAGSPLLPASTSNPMSFAAVSNFLAANPGNFLASIGIVLVLSGVCFKIGAVPFQIWIPDVYQGAPTPVTAFLAVSSKAAGFAILLTLVKVFHAYSELTITVLTVIAVLTIIFGNLAALTQHNVKRLLGLSGVSHAGYLLLGVIASASVSKAVGAIFFYLLAYLLASFAVFAVMVHVSGDNDAEQELDHYSDLGKNHPFLAGVLAIGLGSLAGIPPLAGFMGKLMVFMSVFSASEAPAGTLTSSCYYGLLAVAVVGVVISIYYYFGWIRSTFFQTWRAPLMEGEVDPRPKVTPVTLPLRATMICLVAATIVLGFYQGNLPEWLSTLR